MSKTGWSLLAFLLLSGAAMTQDRLSLPAAMREKAAVPSFEAQYDVLGTYRNSPRGPAVHWVRLPAGPVEGTGGIHAPPVGQGLPPKRMALTFAHMPPYSPFRAHRKSSMTFQRGEPVFILEDAEGAPWVMLAFSRPAGSTLAYSTLKELGSKLKPPAGWKFHVLTFDRNLTISALENYNWLVQDELQNTYGACKEGACSFQP